MDHDEKLYILWDLRNGAPRRSDDGEYISDGVLGAITIDNVYLYAMATDTRVLVCPRYGSVSRVQPPYRCQNPGCRASGPTV